MQQIFRLCSGNSCLFHGTILLCLKLWHYCHFSWRHKKSKPDCKGLLNQKNYQRQALDTRAQAVLPGGLHRVKQHQLPSLVHPPEILGPRQGGRGRKGETENGRRQWTAFCFDLSFVSLWRRWKHNTTLAVIHTNVGNMVRLFFLTASPEWAVQCEDCMAILPKLLSYEITTEGIQLPAVCI